MLVPQQIKATRLPLGAILWAVASSMVLFGCAPSPHDLVTLGKTVSLQKMLEAQPERVHASNRLGKTPLHYAVSNKRAKMMALLADKGADLDAADATGMTPLHVAAMMGRLDEAKWLLERGALLEPRDQFGDTPVHTAAVFGHGHVVKLLHQRGASLTSPNGAGKVPVELARENREKRAAVYLQQLIEQSASNTDCVL